MKYLISGWYSSGLFSYTHDIYKSHCGERWDHVVTRNLDFISYHLIRLIHGQEKLDEMARTLPEILEFK